MKKTIMITGALGHIGSKLIRYLPKNLNANFILIDNFNSERYCSLFNLPFKNFDFYNEDINKFNFKKIKKKVDIVVHLAALTDATKSLTNKKKYLENNLGITKKILHLCKSKKSKLVYISSTSIYGSQNKMVDEFCTKKELKPQSPYAISKFKEEQLINHFYKNYGVKSVILRFGTIFGISEGMRFHTAVNKFCFQASVGEPLTIWRTALNQKRPYLDLIDGVRSILFCINKDLFDGQTYNVLTHNLTVKSIVNEIKKIYPRQKIIFVNNKIMNQLSYEVSTKRLRLKGFNYVGNLSKSVKETLELIKIR